jgi:nucleotide-binding universal stress UspA family protein
MKRSESPPVVAVGFGGSAASTAAVIWGEREARRRGARLRVIQAWQPHPLHALYAAGGGSARQSPSCAEEAGLLAAQVRSTLGGATGLQLVTDVVEGPPERVLVEASSQADLLVLGSGSQSQVGPADPRVVDRPVGPVVRACLSHARCPVVIITRTFAPMVTNAGHTGTRLSGAGQVGARPGEHHDPCPLAHETAVARV